MPILLSMEKDVSDVFTAYKRLEKRFAVTSHFGEVTYDSPVNFRESAKHPRHRWIEYKEGYSPSFVKCFIDRFCSNPKRKTLLDPFCGVGTTILQACFMGHRGIGFDVNPLAHFIAKTKCISFRRSDFSEFDRAVRMFDNSKLAKRGVLPPNETVRSYFEPAYLDALLRSKEYFIGIENERIQSLFKLAFLSIIETFSTHRKAGNGLKRKTRVGYRQISEVPIQSIKKSIIHRLEIYRQDLHAFPKINGAEFVLGSSLDLGCINGGLKFNAVLTSPPYMNCFDYSKIYICELWMGDFFKNKNCQKKFRDASVRSHVHATWAERNDQCGSNTVEKIIYPILSKKKMWSAKIPSTIRGYFRDIGKFFSIARDYLSAGDPMGFVVSNSAYAGVPIATDLLLAEVGEKYGFRCEEIETYRHIVPSSQQFNAIDDKKYFRESLVVFKKV